ncbi:hypothetical protein F5Y15DRAFT_415442 [Xylariaceae sp. FL0016]|nr:hypothetical protein F5Y15DRAFT_415442 [Xylariaceae sp. FL0016]
MSSSTSVLVTLPGELFVAVASYLPNSAIKNLRLACKALHERAILRLERVFLSPNPRNIEVLRAIADHDEFRQHVVELIWDDAQLLGDVPHPDEYLLPRDEPPLPWESPPPPQEFPRWYSQGCQDNILYLTGGRNCVKRSTHPDLSAAKQKLDEFLRIEASWSHYQELYRQQRDTIVAGADIEALRYSLSRFPALRRITITPAAHGMPLLPLYETPMIRALPTGFNYPLPRGWPTPGPNNEQYRLRPWVDDDEREKDKWRGFRIITRELANTQQKHHVTELVLDVHHLPTGLNCHIFEQPNEEYDNLVKIMQRPDF